MRPIIGITVNYDEEEKQLCLREYYTESIYKAGGIPVLLVPGIEPELIRAYLQLCHGFVLSGGGDIDPLYWGEEPDKGLGRISPLRDSFEVLLARAILEQQRPLLGICRGCQVMNVAGGGTLWQDLETGLKHMQEAPRSYPIHEIRIENASLLKCIMKSEAIRVNSFHHQAVKSPGAGFKISARASDGTVEAIEGQYAGVFCLGVQWHPECMVDENAQALFRYFVRSSYQ